MKWPIEWPTGFDDIVPPLPTKRRIFAEVICEWPRSEHPWVVGAGRNLVRDGRSLDTKMDIFDQEDD